MDCPCSGMFSECRMQGVYHTGQVLLLFGNFVPLLSLVTSIIINVINNELFSAFVAVVNVPEYGLKISAGRV